MLVFKITKKALSADFTQIMALVNYVAKVEADAEWKGKAASLKVTNADGASISVPLAADCTARIPAEILQPGEITVSVSAGSLASTELTLTADNGQGAATGGGGTGGTGTVGPQGPKGPKGDKGDKGDPGEAGPEGPMGPQGIQGLQGIQGPKGDKGDIGATGATGATGAQGPKGATGAAGAVGPQGPAGAAGATGPQGATGAKGAKGDKGDPGQSFAISKLYATPAALAAETTPVAEGNMVAVIEGTAAKVYMRSQATTATGNDLAGYKYLLDLAEASVIKGDKGDKGETGAQGPQGAEGPAGPAGATGPKGATGAAGATGPAGAKGADGQGVPTGGTAGQVLAKVDAQPYNAAWIDLPEGGGGTNVTKETDTPNGSVLVDGVELKVYDDTDLKKSVADGKTQVAAAVSAKGIITAADATWEAIANNIGAITTGGQADYTEIAENLTNWGYEPRPVNATTINDKVNEMYQATGTYLQNVKAAFAACGYEPTSANLTALDAFIRHFANVASEYGTNLKLYKDDINYLYNIYASAFCMHKGDLYIFGGKSNESTTLRSSSKFDGVTFTSIAILPVATYYAAACSDGENIYIFGGYGTKSSVKYNTIIRYNPESNKYETVGTLPTASSIGNARYIDGYFYAFPGSNVFYKINAADFTVETITYPDGKSLYFPSIANIDGALYINSAEAFYKYENDTFTALTQGNFFAAANVSFVEGRYIYYIGGYIDDTVYSNICIYDIDKDIWTYLDGAYTVAVSAYCEINNQIYIIAGRTAEHAASATSDVYRITLPPHLEAKPTDCKTIYDALIAKNITPASEKLSDITAAIAAI